MKVVLYGKNRCGKTTLACQWPKPLLLLAMEPNRTGGALSVRKVPGVIYKRVTTLEGLYAVAEELVATALTSNKWEGRLQSVVLDSATSLQDVCLMKVLGLAERLEQNSFGLVNNDQYRERSEMAKKALRPWIDLRCHVVVTAKEKDHNPRTEDRNKLTRGLHTESFFAADMGGATAEWLHDVCDFIGQLYVDRETEEYEVKVQGKPKIMTRETGRQIRRLRTTIDVNFAAGFRSDTPGAVPKWINRPTYERIKAVADGEMIEDAEYEK